MKREEQQPLHGRTVLLTRARAQSSRMAARLESLGASVIHCPTIEIVPPTSWTRLDASIGKLEEYDWIAFTSANAVEFFIRRLRDRRKDGIEAIRQVACCAIGPATAEALESAGVVAQVIASESRSEGALKAIVDHLGSEDAIRGVAFLIPRARSARNVLPAGLRSLGARVDDVETYQTVKPNLDGESIIRLLQETSIDVITFTSPSTVSNFSELVGANDLSDLLANTRVACIGPVTAEAAARHGLANIIQPETYSASALVESIVQSIGVGS